MARSSSYSLGLACFAVAVAVAGATQFTVGGANGWSVPGAGAEPLNTWAERTRFQVGDSLVFVYPKDQDSVLLVEPADYNACNTSSYVKKFDNGDTVFTLDHSGAFFFISGVEANCRANEKLIVMVLAAGRNDTSGSAAPPPTAAAPPPTAAAPPPPTSSTTPPPPASPAPKAPAAASPPPASSASAPPPASAPTTTPSAPPPASSPPAPGASSPAPVSSTPPPSAPGRAPEAPPAPSASSPAPSAQGTTANSTGTPSPRPAGSKDKNGAALAVASGLASSLGACALGYAMLAL
ncbi:hypothetical protein GQ55_1G044800 [Panicum hallii var. hallii]|uniref:Phytocyanin domain-containing protein n=1 Tax=Panicum hallii var. hallii TaxID=1504633 RepID=A0A2T7F265_9POAL|nr:hypothetical protein GQ55_1G044800 [Panicum hallii var. hallii]